MSDIETAPRRPLDLAARALLRRVCRLAASVPFRVVDWTGRAECFGDGSPRFTVTVRHPRAVWRVAAAPDPGLGDAYVAGDVEVEPLETALEAYHGVPRRGPLWSLLRRLRPRRPRSVSRRAQSAQVRSHYDRGNDFFSLWLDSSRTYSCAYFRRPGDDLDQAQRAKVELILGKAQLSRGQTLLDIGCGWGALVMEAARRGARATGITLSPRQHEHAEGALRDAGLSDRARVLLADYRDLARRGPRFDRIVSVGMLEHVGRRNLAVFLRAVKDLLEPGGVCVLHAIMRARESATGPWVDRNIFPGGYIPSWREVVALLPEFDFHLVDAESLRRHYARTLACWRARFEERLSEVRELGFDEPFIRMWRLYLEGSAAGFRTGALDLQQLVFTSGINNELAWTRERLYAPVSPSSPPPSF